MRKARQTPPKRTSHRVEVNKQEASGELSMSEEIVQQQAKRNSELLTQEQVAELAELSVDLPDESPDEAELIEEEVKRAATLEEGLWLRAGCLQDGKAAEELWNRSHRATSWLTSLILERPDLFAQPLRSSTAVPMMISLIPTSPWYYDKLAAHLNKHHGRASVACFVVPKVVLAAITQDHEGRCQTDCVVACLPFRGIRIGRESLRLDDGERLTALAL